MSAAATHISATQIKKMGRAVFRLGNPEGCGYAGKGRLDA
jgi:hypothetical protein